MLREAAIAQNTVGAQKIWLGYVELGPGLISAVHHHGEAESGIYIISGDARFYSGDQLDERPRSARRRFRVGAAAHGARRDEHQPDRAGAHGRGAFDAGRLTFNLPTPEGWRPDAEAGAGCRGWRRMAYSECCAARAAH